MDIQFRLHSRDDFEQLHESQGFVAEVLYADYARAEFEPTESLFRIWILRKASR